MSKQEAIAIVNPWLGRDRSPPLEHRAPRARSLRRRMNADEMSGGRIDAYAAAITPWITGAGRADQSGPPVFRRLQGPPLSGRPPKRIRPETSCTLSLTRRLTEPVNPSLAG